MTDGNDQNRLQDAIARLPPGAWAVGVSGGADSVALLHLLRRRDDLALHVVHLDHETRGQQSADDARFVQDLALKWNLPCTVERRSQVEPELRSLPANPSARYRMARLALFRRVVSEQRLAGVILAHHADDQAETVFQRLLRGSGPSGLGGMSPRASVGGLLIVRPLLDVRRAELRRWLDLQQLSWREDPSNVAPAFLRSRVRRLLVRDESLTQAMLDLSAACRGLRRWLRGAAPELPDEFPLEHLRDLPGMLARESARRWLVRAGAPPQQITAEVCDRLVQMASDAATPPRVHFPGRVLVRRRRGRITVVLQD